MAATVTGMKKRILAAFLWFYAGWYAGAMLADVIGISPLFGPLLGAAAAALIVGDPRQIIWTRPQTSSPASPPVSSPEPA